MAFPLLHEKILSLSYPYKLLVIYCCGDFQESCHPLAAIQAAFVDGSARVGSGSSGGLLIHTSSG